MKSNFAIFVLLLGSTAVGAFGQEQGESQESPVTQLAAELFENTLLHPGEFRMALDDVFPDSNTIEEIVRHSIEFYQIVESESSFLMNSVEVGELVSFEIRDEAFFFRAMSKEQWQQLSQESPQDLTSDLKAKELFLVKKVTPDCLVIEKGSTRIAIPVKRIIYFQRGPEAFFK